MSFLSLCLSSLLAPLKNLPFLLAYIKPPIIIRMTNPPQIETVIAAIVPDDGWLESPAKLGWVAIGITVEVDGTLAGLGLGLGLETIVSTVKEVGLRVDEAPVKVGVALG